MTTEEAGELVLRTPEWLECSGCWEQLDGKGQRVNKMACSTCQGQGYVLKPKYAEAYRLLNVPTPSPWTTTVLNGVAHTMGPVLDVGKFPIRAKLAKIDDEDPL